MSALNLKPNEKDFSEITVRAWCVFLVIERFNELVLKDAIMATAKHRGTTEQIKDVPTIISNIEESMELKNMWDKYRKQFSYATDIEYNQIICALKKLVMS